MKTSEVAQAEAFEDELEKTIANHDMYPDLRETLTSDEQGASSILSYMVKRWVGDQADTGTLYGLYEPPQTLPFVAFHAQPGLSLAQANQIALQNNWTLATAKQVKDLWKVGVLDVYAYGLLADGRFAVPVQSDHANVQRGTNIGAQGGNQGFFYIGVDTYLPNGDYQMRVKHSGQCMGVSGGNNTPGEPVVQWPCGAQNNLTFIFKRQTDGSYEIRAKHSDQCLNVSGGTNTPGAQAIQNPCQGADNERFWLRRRANGTIEIIAKHSGLALAVEGAYQTNAAKVIQWQNYPEPHFEWIFEKAIISLDEL